MEGRDFRTFFYEEALVFTSWISLVAGMLLVVPLKLSLHQLPMNKDGLVHSELVSGRIIKGSRDIKSVFPIYGSQHGPYRF